MGKGSLHLVFPAEILDSIAGDLEQVGYTVAQRDSSIDTMVDWATSTEEKIDCAVVYGLAVTSLGESNNTKEAAYQLLKQVRIHQEDMRLIVLFPEMMKYDKDFISKIAQLNIYDIHFMNSLNTNDIVYCIENKRGFQHVERLLSDYESDEEDEAYDVDDMFETEEEDEEEEIQKETLQEKFFKRKQREKENTKNDKEREKIQFPSFFMPKKGQTEEEQPKKLPKSPKKPKETKEKQYNLLENISHITTKLTPKKETVKYKYRSFSSKVIVVTGTKGGIGKTEVTLNLAAALREETYIDRICVVDFGFPYGSIASALQISRKANLSHWKMEWKEGKTITEEGLKGMVVNTEGIDFIPLPLKAHESLTFHQEQAEFMIDTLRNFYDAVLIDASSFSSVTKIALERANDIILLTNHDVSSISNCLAYKEEMIRSYGIDYEKVSVFLNQVPKNEDIKKDAIAEAVEDGNYPTPIIGYALYDDAVRLCRNRGEWIYYEKPKHSFSKGMDMLLDGLGFYSRV